ncbi:MAG TPA: hypothetical protein VHL77_05385 [Ferruginibacter sp.]|jgi:hypothetical protein|nr:hypothetical protein [Ferruginibacter sp.]
MERVETLLKKLQDQFNNKASAGQLLLTVQMLQAELMQLQENHAQEWQNGNVFVSLSNINPPVNRSQTVEPEIKVEDEKTTEVLLVDEAELEAELEEIKRNAEAMQKISVQNKPSIIFETEEEVPTLSHQQQPKQKTEPAFKEINEAAGSNGSSLNEKLRQSKIDLGEALTEVPIRDLRKAIGINDRFLFINELFRGDEAAYERSIKTINGFSIFAEAEYWIQRELKVKNGWDPGNEMVAQFYQLVKRRFS